MIWRVLKAGEPVRFAWFAEVSFGDLLVSIDSEEPDAIARVEWAAEEAGVELERTTE